MTEATNIGIPGPLFEHLMETDASGILRRLPQMGRIMVIGQGTGVTHERIGLVETVEIGANGATLSGAAHAAQIPLGPIRSMRLDRSSKMRDKIYPRIDFLDSSGTVLFAVVGMEGLEQFENALDGIARSACEAPAGNDSAKPELGDDDPAHGPFAALTASGAEVTIRLSRPGLVQDWRGRIETVKHAMGFLNVMTGDFHLHLSGGSVSGWREGPGQRAALGEGGIETGLVLMSEVFA